MLRIGVVAEHNLKATPDEDKRGVQYPQSYVKVRKLWAASPQNPDPVTAHPIPVFVNRQHKNGEESWGPLPVGTRVVVAEIEKTPLNREGFAVIAFGPEVDSLFGDVRETAYYRNYQGGSQDKVVVAPTDPVEGPNADYGRYHRDGEGMGWHTLRPYPDDPERREMVIGIPGGRITFDHRLDESTNEAKLEVEGPAVEYTVLVDGKNGALTIEDDQDNVIELNSVAGTLTFTIQGDVTVNAQEGGALIVNAEGNVALNADGDVLLGGAGGPAVARVGDAVSVSTTTGIGTITSGSTKVSSL